MYKFLETDAETHYMEKPPLAPLSLSHNDAQAEETKNKFCKATDLHEFFCEVVLKTGRFFMDPGADTFFFFVAYFKLL